MSRREQAARRIADLPAHCRELELHLFNDEDDPSPLFDGLAYREVMAIALRDPVVARALMHLPANWRWPDE